MVVIVFTFVVMIVMTMTTVDMLFGAGAQANQHVQGHATAAGFDDFDGWRQLFGDFQAHTGRLRLIRSALLRMTRSALASWSANSSCSGDSWSRFGSSLRWAST